MRQRLYPVVPWEHCVAAEWSPSVYRVPNRIHPELHTLVEEQLISMLRFEHRGKLVDCSPTESDWFGMLSLIGQSDGNKVRTYISVKDACKFSGYKQQYLRRLLRQKKLTRKKIGQVWRIEVSSLETYWFLLNESPDRRFGHRTKR